ncbi:hypothetical protein, partial [Cysteiniphilum sp. 6C5]
DESAKVDPPKEDDLKNSGLDGTVDEGETSDEYQNYRPAIIDSEATSDSAKTMNAIGICDLPDDDPIFSLLDKSIKINCQIMKVNYESYTARLNEKVINNLIERVLRKSDNDFDTYLSEGLIDLAKRMQKIISICLENHMSCVISVTTVLSFTIAGGMIFQCKKNDCKKVNNVNSFDNHDDGNLEESLNKSFDINHKNISYFNAHLLRSTESFDFNDLHYNKILKFAKYKKNIKNKAKIKEDMYKISEYSTTNIKLKNTPPKMREVKAYDEIFDNNGRLFLRVWGIDYLPVVKKEKMEITTIDEQDEIDALDSIKFFERNIASFDSVIMDESYFKNIFKNHNNISIRFFTNNETPKDTDIPSRNHGYVFINLNNLEIFAIYRNNYGALSQFCFGKNTCPQYSNSEIYYYRQLLYGGDLYERFNLINHIGTHGINVLLQDGQIEQHILKSISNNTTPLPSNNESLLQSNNPNMLIIENYQPDNHHNLELQNPEIQINKSVIEHEAYNNNVAESPIFDSSDLNYSSLEENFTGQLNQQHLSNALTAIQQSIAEDSNVYMYGVDNRVDSLVVSANNYMHDINYASATNNSHLVQIINNLNQGQRYILPILENNHYYLMAIHRNSNNELDLLLFDSAGIMTLDSGYPRYLLNLLRQTNSVNEYIYSRNIQGIDDCGYYVVFISHLLAQNSFSNILKLLGVYNQTTLDDPFARNRSWFFRQKLSHYLRLYVQKISQNSSSGQNDTFLIPNFSIREGHKFNPAKLILSADKAQSQIDNELTRLIFNTNTIQALNVELPNTDNGGVIDFNFPLEYKINNKSVVIRSIIRFKNQAESLRTIKLEYFGKDAEVYYYKLVDTNLTPMLQESPYLTGEAFNQLICFKDILEMIYATKLKVTEYLSSNVDYIDESKLVKEFINHFPRDTFVNLESKKIESLDQLEWYIIKRLEEKQEIEDLCREFSNLNIEENNLEFSFSNNRYNTINAEWVRKYKQVRGDSGIIINFQKRV